LSPSPIQITKHLGHLPIQPFLAIDMKESKKSLPSGRNAHLIIEDLHYWIKKFEGHCNIKTLTNDYILYLELTKSKE